MLCLKKMYRITVYVPPSHLEEIIRSITSSIPLRYGNYDSVMWWSGEGTEQFRPLGDSKPSEGESGALSRLPSVMLQFSLPHDTQVLEAVINDAIIPFHPWEEPVIQVQEILATRTSAVED